MMNIQNLSSKESLGVKFKGGICTEVCFKATAIFVMLLSQDGSKSDCPETNSKQSLRKVGMKK